VHVEIKIFKLRDSLVVYAEEALGTCLQFKSSLYPKRTPRMLLETSKRAIHTLLYLYYVKDLSSPPILRLPLLPFLFS
jgi:hypothetical protein